MAKQGVPLMRERICAGEGNCCKNLYLVLQLADIRRISRHTGLHPRKFVRLFALGEFEEEDHEEDAVVQLKSRQCIMGTRRRRGWCLFFNGHGCDVYPFKPLHCDIYPVDYQYVGGRTLIKHHREKWCHARFGGLIPVTKYLELGERCDREQARTQRFVDRWNRLSGGRGTAAEFFDYLAQEVGWRSEGRRRAGNCDV